ncbi:MAG: hypothetical protein ACFE8B_06430 [Candidatus Hermodarchaeota archaeon]
MAMYLYFFEFELVYIILTILWVIQGGLLVVGSRDLKKSSNNIRFLIYLVIAGYLLSIWAIATFFLPTSMELSSPTEIEESLFLAIPLIFYAIIPNTIFIVLGIALLIFFYRNSHLYRKLLVNTSILFVGGFFLRLINSVVARCLSYFDVYAYIDFFDLFKALEIISLCVLIGAVLIITLFSTYINNRYFMAFSCLFLVYLFYLLIPMVPNI